MLEIDAIDALVIGGGPAGSTAAAIMAKAGLRVALLEAGAHPRRHVGESLLPGIIPILEDIGALEAVEAAGFGPKTGSTHRGWGRTERWDLWFADSDAYDRAWLVERARFDAILIAAARRAGATVHERTTVERLHWEAERLVAVDVRARGQRPQTVRTPLVIDASGARALIAEDRGLRAPIEGLQHEAQWAHWEGAGRLPAPRRHQALFRAERDGWLWLFPLSETRTSVGVVRLDRRALTSTTRDYEAAIANSEVIRTVLGSSARRVTTVRRERDWSYRVRTVAGPGWLAVGDAAGFIDPVLSTGVQLAMHTGWHAGHAAVAMLRDGSTDASERYAAHHREQFDDLLRMVRFYYQQNLSAEDYFWESKHILMKRELSLRPDKAFVALTSGLVGNLALEARAPSDGVRGHGPRPEDGDPAPVEAEPDALGFLCIHLRYAPPDAPSTSLYVLVEPRAPGARSLFRTDNWRVNVVAPRHGNDPISVPALAPTLRGVGSMIDHFDTVPGETLATFWRRVREPLVAQLRALPEAFRLARIFGE